MTRSTKLKLLTFAAVVSLMAVFATSDWSAYLSLSYLSSKLSTFREWAGEYWLAASLAYMLVYILSVGLALPPGGAALTLFGGAVFGFWWALVLVSFASTIGASLAFVLARFLFRDYVLRRFGPYLEKINCGIKRDGAFYLFTLRLIPLFPFMAINVVMGLTPISLWTFYWVSQLGMFLGTCVYVNVGTQLATIDSLEGIVSWPIVASFTLLGLLPWFGRGVSGVFYRRRVYRGWAKPRTFDYNLAVIGGGSAGLVSAYIASMAKAKVCLIERSEMGGDCLNTGCVPSKALIRAATLAHQAKEAPRFGVDVSEVKVDFARVMERIKGVVDRIAPHDSRERYRSLGVDCFEGEAVIEDPWTVRVGDKRFTSRAIIIATGASPWVPPIPGLSEMDYLTSDTLWQLRERPKKLLVLGGGPIGCELAQSFARLGSEVCLVEMQQQLLVAEDEVVGELVGERLRDEGVRVLTGHQALSFETREGTKQLVCQKGDDQSDRVTITFDQVLVAVGRRADVSKLSQTLDFATHSDGRLETNEYLQTNYPNIFASGDVTGPYQLTHMASHQAYYAATNALLLGWVRQSVDYRVVPWCTYTDPEVATVGLTQKAAEERGVLHELTTYDLKNLDRAITDGCDFGLLRVLTAPDSGRILGATIVSAHASDMLTEFVAAIGSGKTLASIMKSIHVYPSMSEANKFVAGQWRRRRLSPRLVTFSRTFFRWLR